MMDRTRREFLTDVGRGMLVAGIGYSTAFDLGLTPALADDASGDALDFGPREPLVRLMQDTAPARLLSALAGQLRSGTSLRELVAAAALANARTFGGEDYVGFHTLMALTPAWHMAQQMPRGRKPLPIFKVLYRNTARIQAHGGRTSEVLHPIAPDHEGPVDGMDLLEAVKQKDMAEAEETFARIAQGSPEDAFNELLIAVQHESEVHRVVLPYRAWDLLDLVGCEHAHTLLRQSVRYCVDQESPQYSQRSKGGRDVLPKLLDEYKLDSRALGTRDVDEAWIEEISRTIYGSSPEIAADTVAAALADGIAPAAVSEALALAANQLVLRDAGRPEEFASAAKPAGSVHGDSVGVHSCDATNAWVNMAQIAHGRQAVACLILGAFQIPRDRQRYPAECLAGEVYPRAEHLEALGTAKPEELLREADEAIRRNDQAQACAAIARFGSAGGPARAAFDLLLRYATSEDGALHAEKYYRTASEEFARTRPAFRWRQLAALARVTASEYGYKAPGYEEAERLLPTLAVG